MEAQQAISLFPALRANASVLVIGDYWSAIFGELFNECQARITKLNSPAALTELQAKGVYEFAFVSHTLEYLSKQEGEQFIGILRNLHAARFLLAVPVNTDRYGYKSNWQTNELLAYGLILVCLHNKGDTNLAIYRYDIFDYKVTPDWLNNRYWAHPELFDKYWW